MGKLRGKITLPGDDGSITYKDASGKDITIPYGQPFSAELGLIIGATVSFDTTLDGSTAVSVTTAGKGQIVSFGAGAEPGTPTKGVIFEKETGMKYTFLQSYFEQSGFVLNQMVRYTLVNSGGQLVATCLIGA